MDVSNLPVNTKFLAIRKGTSVLGDFVFAGEYVESCSTGTRYDSNFFNLDAKITHIWNGNGWLEVDKFNPEYSKMADELTQRINNLENRLKELEGTATVKAESNGIRLDLALGSLVYGGDNCIAYHVEYPDVLREFQVSENCDWIIVDPYGKMYGVLSLWVVVMVWNVEKGSWEKV